MIGFIVDNAVNIVLILVISLCLFFAVRYQIKRDGKCCGKDSSCSSCSKKCKKDR